MRGLTPQEVVEEMGIGINLGNAMDVRHVNKTYWGNPNTTEEIVDGILSAGFTTLRVPVTWEFNMGEGPDYVIESAYLQRVEEIVNWGLDNGAYVILNTHHDGHWIIPNYENIDATNDQLGKVWTQIADHFKNYGDRLIFETLNEPRVEGGGGDWGEWSGGTAETRDCVNRANKACVDAIRATGGNNTARIILAPTHAASADGKAMSDWEAPNDDPNIIVSIHAYSPYLFCLTDQDADWGTDADKQALDNLFDSIHETVIVGKGRAVVMGEWGAQNSGLGNELDRIRHAEYYSNACIEHGITPVIWDDGGKFELFERDELNWSSQIHADTVLVPLFGQSFALFQEASPLLSGATGDDDGDGQANLFEYAFGSDPSDADDLAPMPRMELVGGVPTVVSLRGHVNVQYILDWSSDLLEDSWQTISLSEIISEVTVGLDGLREVKQGLAIDEEKLPNLFLRVCIED
ncbi:glycoside hydrolase family 5 protein [Pelagicoccus mobilis]|uniref:Glycoside hydrolase family 5 protein n=2 Tax=Pelagicoccus mobilis TaxID=415221 RepID=A0A934S6T3_9BACT|nr:glycoside hydrolase family 5 protein [Pelagicoccus mobilis]